MHKDVYMVQGPQKMPTGRKEGRIHSHSATLALVSIWSTDFLLVLVRKGWESRSDDESRVRQTWHFYHSRYRGHTCNWNESTSRNLHCLQETDKAQLQCSWEEGIAKFKVWDNEDAPWKKQNLKKKQNVDHADFCFLKGGVSAGSAALPAAQTPPGGQREDQLVQAVMWSWVLWGPKPLPVLLAEATGRAVRCQQLSITPVGPGRGEWSGGLPASGPLSGLFHNCSPEPPPPSCCTRLQKPSWM